MAVSALVAVRSFLAAIGRARREGDFDESAALTLGMAWLVSLPIALVAITGGLVRRPSIFGDLEADYPGWYDPATSAALLLVVGLAIVLLARRLAA